MVMYLVSTIKSLCEISGQEALKISHIDRKFYYHTNINIFKTWKNLVYYLLNIRY